LGPNTNACWTSENTIYFDTSKTETLNRWLESARHEVAHNKIYQACMTTNPPIAAGQHAFGNSTMKNFEFVTDAYAVKYLGMTITPNLGYLSDSSVTAADKADFTAIAEEIRNGICSTLGSVLPSLGSVPDQTPIQWRRDAGSGYVDIPGATSYTYTVTAQDLCTSILPFYFMDGLWRSLPAKYAAVPKLPGGGCAVANEDTPPTSEPTSAPSEPTTPGEATTEPSEPPTQPSETPTEPVTPPGSQPTDSATEPSQPPAQPPVEPPAPPAPPAEPPAQPADPPAEPGQNEPPAEPGDSSTEQGEQPAEAPEPPTPPREPPAPPAPPAPPEPPAPPAPPATQPTEAATEPSQPPAQPAEEPPAEPTEPPANPAGPNGPTGPTVPVVPNEVPAESGELPTEPAQTVEQPMASEPETETKVTDPTDTTDPSSTQESLTIATGGAVAPVNGSVPAGVAPLLASYGLLAALVGWRRAHS
jgi:hypothetical protein